MDLPAPSAAGRRVDIEHQEERTMAEKDYSGSAGYARREDPTAIQGHADVVDERARRNALIARLPYGRALDQEHLKWMLDEGNQRNQALVMRRRLLEHAGRNLPDGILVRDGEVGQALVREKEAPVFRRQQLDMPEWPPSS